MQSTQHLPPSTPPAQLLVMPEYLSCGLWCPRPSDQFCADGTGFVRECEPAALGVSTLLQARLASWCAEYERLDVARPGNSPDLRPFAAEGLAIARALQGEMPHAEVWYFDENLHDQGRPRPEYRYRVLSRS